MKYKEILKVLSILIVLFLSSCATAKLPIMQLHHTSPDKTAIKYSNKGTIKVLKFKDSRISEENIDNEYKKSSDGSYVWSNQTNPAINEFLKTTIEDEISASGLFTISDSAEYELSGKIKSLSNAHVDGNGTLLGSLFANLGYIYGAGNELILSLSGRYSLIGFYLPAVIGLSVGVLIKAFNSDHFTTVISYDVTLKKNGVEVWKDEINVVAQEKHHTGLKGNKKIMYESSIILDKNITLAIQQMIQRMNEKVN